MRYFLTGRHPKVDAILLIESGSRGLLEGVVGGLRQTWGEAMPIDVVSCYAQLPKGFEAHNTRVYRIGDYRGRAGRARLVAELRRNHYGLLGMISSGEVVMAKVKWLLALRIPAKVFIINENGDYFWLDRRHLSNLRQFVLFRSGLGGAGAVRTLVRLISFPFALFYLLLYATAAHTRRALRRG